MVASSTAAASFGQRADTGGMHHLAWVMLGAGVLYLLLNVLDRTLDRATGDRWSCCRVRVSGQRPLPLTRSLSFFTRPGPVPVLHGRARVRPVSR